MADLLTHAAVGYIIARPIRDPRARALVMAGTALPDVIYRVLVFGTRSSTWYAEITHSPLPLILICALIAMLFSPPLRRRAFWGLLIGSATHVLLDMGKNYLGHGVILWAYPFSMDRVEFGLYHNEQTIFFMPFAVLAIAMTEIIVRVIRRPA